MAANALPPITTVTLADFTTNGVDERTVTYAIEPEVRVHINICLPTFNENKKLRADFCHLGRMENTIEQSVGRTLLERAGNNW